MWSNLNNYSPLMYKLLFNNSNWAFSFNKSKDHKIYALVWQTWTSVILIMFRTIRSNNIATKNYVQSSPTIKAITSNFVVWEPSPLRPALGYFLAQPVLSKLIFFPKQCLPNHDHKLLYQGQILCLWSFWHKIQIF